MHPDTELEAELEAATPILEAPRAPDREEGIAREAALFEPVTASICTVKRTVKYVSA